MPWWVTKLDENQEMQPKIRKCVILIDLRKMQSVTGCTDYTILKFVIEMLNVKVMTNLSNKGPDMMLELLIKVL